MLMLVQFVKKQSILLCAIRSGWSWSQMGVCGPIHALIDMKYVSQGPDEADKWIADSADIGDLVITNDILLAAEVIKAGALVLRPDGSELSAQNIGNQLASRDLMADLRAAQPLDMAKMGGGRAYSASDRARFKQALEKNISASRKQT